MNRKIAIMQPYVFPYLGYFQLIHAVDTFVFYDDVHFIKRGWINRNKLLVNGEESLFSIPLVKASQNRLIKDTMLQKDTKWLDQFYRTLEQHYGKAPQFETIFPMVREVLDKPHKTIADLAIDSIQTLANYLELKTQFEISSKNYPETQGLEKADRLITITKKKGYNTYVNPSGGTDLYKKNYFLQHGVQLLFIANELVPYRQLDHTPLVGLSIIDVLMFNTKKGTRQLMEHYKIV